jgi:hypothetical protein
VKVVSRFAPPALLPSQSLDPNVYSELVEVENDGENDFLHRFFLGGINPSFLKNNGFQYFDNLADVIYDDRQ